MASMTDYLEDALANHVFRNTAFTSPTTVYLALYTDETTDAGGGTEVSGGSYARQTVSFGAPSAGQIVTDADITFADMPAATVISVAILDAASGGNMLAHGPLATSKTVNAGDNLTLSAGDLTFTFS